MSTPEKRPVSFFSLFNRGQHYAKTWPLDKRLAPVFIENRIIRATRYAIRIMPPIAIFTLCCLSAPSNNWIKLSLMICNSLRKTHIKEGA